MSETIRLYGPVQGMVRIDNARPAGCSEARTLSELIKRQGCAGCPRLNARRTTKTSYSYPCRGVGWIGLVDAYLYEHQGHAVHATGSEKCQLIGKTMNVPENLVTPK